MFSSLPVMSAQTSPPALAPQGPGGPPGPAAFPLQMMPGPYGRRFPMPQGMPVPGSMPVPSGSLPPLPLPPWGDWQGGFPTSIPTVAVTGPAGAPVGAGMMPSVNPAYPPSALDFQTTVAPNPVTSHVPAATLPNFAPGVYVAPHATIIGDVTLGGDTFVGFGATLRADYGSPFFIGPRSSIQDHVIVHGEPGQYVEAEGRRWSVYLEGDVSCLHNAVIHGPLRVGKNVYIGAGAVLHTAEVGDDCVVMHNATVTGGAKIPAGRFVGPGQVVQSQAEADALPEVPQAARQLNPHAVKGYVELAKAYTSQLPVAVSPAG